MTRAQVIAVAFLLVEGSAEPTGNFKWVHGSQGQTCADACASLPGDWKCDVANGDFGLPVGKQDFDDIAHLLGISCNLTISGESCYDPSNAQGYCGWQREPNHCPPFCSATPPPMTRRLCPCSKPFLSPRPSAARTDCTPTHTGQRQCREAWTWDKQIQIDSGDILYPESHELYTYYGDECLTGDCGSCDCGEFSLYAAAFTECKALFHDKCRFVYSSAFQDDDGTHTLVSYSNTFLFNDVTLYDNGKDLAFARRLNTDRIDFNGEHWNSLELDIAVQNPTSRASPSNSPWYSVWLAPGKTRKSNNIAENGEIDIIENLKNGRGLSTGFAGCGERVPGQPDRHPGSDAFCKPIFGDLENPKIDPTNFKFHYTVRLVNEGKIEIRRCEWESESCSHVKKVASIDFKLGYEQTISKEEKFFPDLWGPDNDHPDRLKFILMADIWGTHDTGLTISIQNMKFWKGPPATACNDVVSNAPCYSVDSYCRRKGETDDSGRFGAIECSQCSSKCSGSGGHCQCV